MLKDIAVFPIQNGKTFVGMKIQHSTLSKCIYGITLIFFMYRISSQQLEISVD